MSYNSIELGVKSCSKIESSAAEGSPSTINGKPYSSGNVSMLNLHSICTDLTRVFLNLKNIRNIFTIVIINIIYHIGI